MAEPFTLATGCNTGKGGDSLPKRIALAWPFARSPLRRRPAPGLALAPRQDFEHMKTPRTDLQANTYEFEITPLVKATGFREYDARWWFGGPQYPKAPELNFLGVQALGLGLGTLIREMGVAPKIVTGHDYRSYSLSIKQALTLGLLEAGMEVHDIGLALSPVAYWAQFALDIPCVAMVTASHNENGWTGVKMGANRPLTCGPEEIGRLKEILLGAKFNPQPCGKL